jgi:hypothetical protein
MRVSLPHLGHAVDFVVSMTFFRSAVFAIFAIHFSPDRNVPPAKRLRFYLVFWEYRYAAAPDCAALERRPISNRPGSSNTREAVYHYSPLESYTNCRREVAENPSSKLPAAVSAPRPSLEKNPAFLRGCLPATVEEQQPGHFPVPVSAEVCGLLIPLSATLNDPVLVPVIVGVKVTLILQLALATRLVVQVVEETLKSPLVEITMLFSATFCLLVSVNTFAGLVVPTFSAE